MRDYYIPSEVAKLMGTTGTMVRLCLLQRAPGWEDIKFFMCGRDMKIPRKQFDQWFESTAGRCQRMKMQEAKMRRAEERKPIPVEYKPLKVKKVIAARRVNA